VGISDVMRTAGVVAVQDITLQAGVTAAAIATQSPGKSFDDIYKMLLHACQEPFVATAHAFKQKPDSPGMISRGVRGSCYMDIVIGTTLLILLPTVPLDDLECIENERWRNLIDYGEFFRYFLYEVYGIGGLFGLFIINRYKKEDHLKLHRFAAILFLGMVVVCCFIMWWSIIVITFGIKSLQKYDCNSTTR